MSDIAFVARVAFRKRLEALRQLGPPDIHTGRFISKNTLAPRPFQGGNLQVRILFAGRYPRIACFHIHLLSVIYGTVKPLI